jgi:hypothetical protein
MISVRNRIGERLGNEPPTLPATTAWIPRSEAALAVSHIAGMGRLETSSSEFVRFDDADDTG